jgi:hypothetical protein
MTKAEKKFRQACKVFDRPKAFQGAIVKFARQYLRVLDIHKKLKGDARKEMLKSPKPSGWRLKVFLKLRKTVLKELPQDKDFGRNHYYIVGKSIGVATNLRFFLKGIIENKVEKRLFTETFGFSPDLGKLLTSAPKEKHSTKDAQNSLFPSQMADFSLGMHNGSKAVFNDGFDPIHGSSTTEIYVIILLFSNIIQQAPNVYALWDFFRERRGDDFTHSPETLERLLRRVGIPLALKSNRKDKSPDMVKAACLGNKI